MTCPKISIITPSFNQANFLEETILSVINQNYPNLEYFVIDGGSTDHSVEIIKQYENKIDFWVSEKDKGQSNAINKGFAKATGSIITWLNSDDVLTPGILQKIAKEFSQLPNNVGLIYGGTTLFDEKGIKGEVWGYEDNIFPRSLAGMAFPQPSSFFKKAVLEEVGFLDESLHYGMDYDLFARLSMACEFTFLPEIFSKYRLHSQSKSIAQGMKFIPEWERVFYRVLNLYQLQSQKQFIQQLGIGLNFINEKFPVFKQPKYQPSQQEAELMLMYFCVRWLHNMYGDGQYQKSKAIYAKLITRFPKDLMENERGFRLIAQRLEHIPVPILKTAKFGMNLIRKFKSN